MNIKEQRKLFIKRYNVSCETMKKFDQYHYFLQEEQKNINLIGWILFIISAIGFTISSIGSFWAMFGSLFFLVACLIFLIPFFREEKDEK